MQLKKLGCASKNENVTRNKLKQTMHVNHNVEAFGVHLVDSFHSFTQEQQLVLVCCLHGHHKKIGGSVLCWWPLKGRCCSFTYTSVFPRSSLW